MHVTSCCSVKATKLRGSSYIINISISVTSIQGFPSSPTMPRGMQPKPSPKLSPFPKPTTTTAITMENQDTGVIKKKIKNINETHPNNHHHKDVLISVYVESPSPLPSPSNTQIRRRITPTTDPIKKISPKPPSSKNNPPTAKARGYDRRAQLLAYARELRNADSKQVQWPRYGSRPKPKVSFCSGWYAYHACNQCKRTFELH